MDNFKTGQLSTIATTQFIEICKSSTKAKHSMAICPTGVALTLGNYKASRMWKDIMGCQSAEEALKLSYVLATLKEYPELISALKEDNETPAGVGKMAKMATKSAVIAKVDELKAVLANDGANVSICVPPGSISRPDYAKIIGKAITHSPQERARFLYDAVKAREPEPDGPYKFDVIKITSGFGNEDTLDELQKLIEKEGPLPQRYDNLKIIGFSDATQALHFFEQRSIATSVYYSGDISYLCQDLASGKFDKEANFEVEVCNDCAKAMKRRGGKTLPGSSDAAEASKLHPTTLFECNSDEYNIIIHELYLGQNTEQGNDKRAGGTGYENKITDFVKLVERLSKEQPVAILLSKDTTDAALETLLAHMKERGIDKTIPVLRGAPVGHGSCLRYENAQYIALGAMAKIEINEQTGTIRIKPWASRDVEKLSKSRELAAIRAEEWSKNPTHIVPEEYGLHIVRTEEQGKINYKISFDESVFKGGPNFQDIETTFRTLCLGAADDDQKKIQIRNDILNGKGQNISFTFDTDLDDNTDIKGQEDEMKTKNFNWLQDRLRRNFKRGMPSDYSGFFPSVIDKNGKEMLLNPPRTDSGIHHTDIRAEKKGKNLNRPSASTHKKPMQAPAHKDPHGGRD